MKTQPRQLVLRKIASRRKRAHQFDDRAAWVTYIPRQANTLQAGSAAGLLGPRLLTRREEQVLRLVAGGETDRRIAERLYVSKRTINTHVSNILAKLDVESRREAVVTAVRLGLL